MAVIIWMAVVADEAVYRKWLARKWCLVNISNIVALRRAFDGNRDILKRNTIRRPFPNKAIAAAHLSNAKILLLKVKIIRLNPNSELSYFIG